jgi:diguanylate cyclase (GGDEF)-like protein
MSVLSTSNRAPNDAHRRTGASSAGLLGTPTEERLERIIRLARRMFGVSMARIDIMGGPLAGLNCGQGCDGPDDAREGAYFFYQTVLGDGVNSTADARVDTFALNGPIGHHWAFYAWAFLYFDGERVGTLCIGDAQSRDFGADEKNDLNDLAALASHELQVAALSEAQIALASSNAVLKQTSRMDVLTQLLNRRAILETLEAALMPAAAPSLAVLMVDTDHFKRINDTLGHLAGDQVLRVIAARLLASIRATDAVGRYGGEEFMVVLEGAGEREARFIAERVREHVSSTAIPVDGGEIWVTCSIGVAVATETQGMEWLIRQADQALYCAKRAGRNRVEMSRREQGVVDGGTVTACKSS